MCMIFCLGLIIVKGKGEKGKETTFPAFVILLSRVIVRSPAQGEGGEARRRRDASHTVSYQGWGKYFHTSTPKKAHETRETSQIGIYPIDGKDSSNPTKLNQLSPLHLALMNRLYEIQVLVPKYPLPPTALHHPTDACNIALIAPPSKLCRIQRWRV